jgi:hypothetical protein
MQHSLGIAYSSLGFYFRKRPKGQWMEFPIIRAGTLVTFLVYGISLAFDF